MEKEQIFQNHPSVWWPCWHLGVRMLLFPGHRAYYSRCPAPGLKGLSWETKYDRCKRRTSISKVCSGNSVLHRALSRWYKSAMTTMKRASQPGHLLLSWSVSPVRSKQRHPPSKTAFCSSCPGGVRHTQKGLLAGCLSSARSAIGEGSSTQSLKQKFLCLFCFADYSPREQSLMQVCGCCVYTDNVS